MAREDLAQPICHSISTESSICSRAWIRSKLLPCRPFPPLPRPDSFQTQVGLTSTVSTEFYKRSHPAHCYKIFSASCVFIKLIVIVVIRPGDVQWALCINERNCKNMCLNMNLVQCMLLRYIWPFMCLI